MDAAREPDLVAWACFFCFGGPDRDFVTHVSVSRAASLPASVASRAADAYHYKDEDHEDDGDDDGRNGHWLGFRLGVIHG